MYCNNCGNELVEGSKFCSNCGQKTISVPKQKFKFELSKVISPLSKSKICLLLIWWIIAGLVSLIYLWVNYSDYIALLFVAPIYIAMPFLFMLVRKKKNNNITIHDSVNNVSVSNQQLNSMPLTDFAKEYGKMQVCKVADKDGNIYSKCIFTKITEVKFASEVGELTASEISSNKLHLVINRNIDGTYELSSDGNQLYRSADSECPPPLDHLA